MLLSYQRSPSVAAPVSVVALAVKLRFLKLLYVPAVILMFAEPYPETLPSAILISLPVLVVNISTKGFSSKTTSSTKNSSSSNSGTL